MNEALIAKHMAALNISREEAIQLIEDDKAIDRGAKMFDLDPELEKGAKKARQADRKPNANPVKRERKANPTKADLVSIMVDALTEDGVIDDGTLTIVNNEREFEFYHNGTRYKVIMSCPRK